MIDVLEFWECASYLKMFYNIENWLRVRDETEACVRQEEHAILVLLDPYRDG